MKIKIKLDMPGTYRVFEDGQQHDANNINPIVLNYMRPLISRLHALRPQWEFHATSAHAQQVKNGTSHHGRFNVMDGDDKLGWIDNTTKYVKGDNVRAYRYEGHRISKGRRGNNEVITVSEDKAVKEIVEHFYCLTIPERVTAATAKIGSQLTAHSSKAQRAMAESKGKLDSHLLRFAMRRWKEFTSEVDTPELQDIARGFPKLARTSQQMAALNGSRSNGRGFVIIARGDNCILQRTGDGNKALVLPSNELPDALRAGIGMLKLIDKDTPMVDVGIKAYDGVYLVMIPEEEILS